MGQPATVKKGLRDSMPDTAEWVDRMRLRYGQGYVDDLIRRATRGKEPGLFYAFEGGRVLGTPFPATHAVSKDQEYAVLMGCSFAGFIKLPEVADGSD